MRLSSSTPSDENESGRKIFHMTSLPNLLMAALLNFPERDNIQERRQRRSVVESFLRTEFDTDRKTRSRTETADERWKLFLATLLVALSSLTTNSLKFVSALPPQLLATLGGKCAVAACQPAAGMVACSIFTGFMLLLLKCA